MVSYSIQTYRVEIFSDGGTAAPTYLADKNIQIKHTDPVRNNLPHHSHFFSKYAIESSGGYQANYCGPAFLHKLGRRSRISTLSHCTFPYSATAGAIHKSSTKFVLRPRIPFHGSFNGRGRLKVKCA